MTAILDSVSQSTLMTTNCMHTLSIDTKPVDIVLNVISNIRSHFRGLTHCNLNTLKSFLLIKKNHVIVVDKITDDLPRYIVSF